VLTADITDTQIRELRQTLFAGPADECQLHGLVACHDALGRSHRRNKACAHCAKLLNRRTMRTKPRELGEDPSARRVLAKCALAMCFDQRVTAPPALCEIAAQLDIPVTSVRRLEQGGLIARSRDGWRLTTTGAQVLQSAGGQVPRKIIKRP
jgi:hypothetical protein